MYAHTSSTPQEIIGRIRSSLAQMEGVSHHNIHIVSDPDSLGPNTQADNICTIWPGYDLQTDEHLFDGAGGINFAVDMRPVVTSWFLNEHRDEPGLAEYFLVGAGGVYDRMRRMCQLLVGDPMSQALDALNGVSHNEETNALRQPTRVEAMEWGQAKDDKGYIRLSLAVSFVWDLNLAHTPWPIEPEAT